MENKQTAVEYIESCIDKYMAYHEGDHKAEPFTIIELREAVEKAKEMEKQRHKKFNDFLQKEIELGISDKATIERIEWYYNTYFINNEQQ